MVKEIDVKNSESCVVSRLSKSTKVFGIAFIAIMAISLSACEKAVQKIEDVRPVRTMTVQASSVNVDVELPGEVRPRIESSLGFRVGGKIIARKVDVGTAVKRGQILMQLDPSDLRLAQSQASAGLAAAQSNLELAAADYKRYQELRAKNFVAQAVLDGKETAYKAAKASHDQAVAAMSVQSNQTAYTNLVADVDGVVTSIDAEAGQVVGAGTPVVRVAQSGEKEVVISIPEDKVDQLRGVADLRIHTWASAEAPKAGKIREISPIADPATRTYRAKISILDPSPDIRLGMTAYVRFVENSKAPRIKLPLTALQQAKEGNVAWVVENGIANPHVVRIGDPDGNDMVILAGVNIGQTVVTAGVNSLRPGQKVKVLESAAPLQTASLPPDPHLVIDASSDSAATVGALGAVLGRGPGASQRSAGAAP